MAQLRPLMPLQETAMTHAFAAMFKTFETASGKAGKLY